jgi:hypothetical protein
MTDNNNDKMVQLLEEINARQKVIYMKLERLENQTAFCVDSLMDMNCDAEGDVLSQHALDEFIDDDDVVDRLPPYSASSSSSTTKQV